MKEQLEDFIRLKLKNPIEKEIKEILDIFHIQTFEKGDIFKRPNKVGKKLGFIAEGGAKGSVIKDNGDEITGRIAQKNDFIGDLISERTQAKTPIFVEFIEPSTVLVTSIKDMQSLLEINLTFNRLIREYIADNMVDLSKLHLIFLTGTSKERYKFILENNPDLLKKLPLRVIASMIGITPTQLSRIRKE